MARAVSVWVVSSGMQDVLGTEQIRPGVATVLGPCRVIPQEYANIQCSSIDIDWQQQWPDRIAREIVEEIFSGEEARVVALRGDTRWVPSLDPIRLGNEAAERGRLRLQKKGVYLVTGGFGGLGSSIARHLAETCQAKLVLVGRTNLLSGVHSSEMDGTQTSKMPNERIRQVQELEALGAEVYSASADVADEDRLRLLLHDARARFGRINGVFHTAGVPGRGLIQRKTREDVEPVLAPKIFGTLALQKLLADAPPDFMVLYSSLFVELGGLGESDYCAANAFLDAFAHRQMRSGIHTVSVNWGLWQWDRWESGVMGGIPEMQQQMKEFRQAVGIGFAEGIDSIYRMLGTPLPQVMVSPVSPAGMAERWRSFSSITQFEAANRGGQRYPRPPVYTAYVAPRNELEEKVAGLWADCLSLENVGMDDHFMELGGNSLLAIVLLGRLQQVFDGRLSASILYEAPTVSALAALLGKDGREAAVANDIHDRGTARRELRHLQRQKRLDSKV